MENAALGVWKRSLSKKYADAVLIRRIQTIEEGLQIIEDMEANQSQEQEAPAPMEISATTQP